MQITTNPSTHSSEARRAAKRYFWDDTTRQQKTSQNKLDHNDRGSFCRSNGQGPFTSQPVWNSWAKNGGTKSRESQVSPHQDSTGCLDSRFGILNGSRDGAKTENRSHLTHILNLNLGGGLHHRKLRGGLHHYYPLLRGALLILGGAPLIFRGTPLNFRGTPNLPVLRGAILN